MNILSTQKLETKLANKWIKALRQSCSNHRERIEIFKVHGDPYQQHNISDWVGCFRGRFVGIEFKVAPNECTRGQIDFLCDIIESGGIGLIIEFVTAKPIEYTIDNAFTILCTSFHSNRQLHYHVSYEVGDWN
jgi:hypothetical protein